MIVKYGGFHEVPIGGGIARKDGLVTLYEKDVCKVL